MHHLRRVLLSTGLLFLLWSALVAISGGFSASVLSFRFSSHDPVRPLIVGAVALAAFVAMTGRSGIVNHLRALSALSAHGPAVTHVVAGSAAVFAFVVAVHWGSFVASGADSYGYVSQADRWRAASLREPLDSTVLLPWRDAEWMLSPLGYRPAPDLTSTVPVYSPGLPLLMAMAQLLTGTTCAALYVVPIAAAGVVWTAFLIGRAIGGAAAGAIAAALIATSPAFLFQGLFPMSDVPVAAAWGAALAMAATDRGARGAFFTGLLAGAAMMIRPNLALVALPFGLYFLFDRQRAPTSLGRLRLAALYAPGVVTAALAIAAINTYLYGSPLESGYGALGDQYRWKNLIPNLRRYPRWAIEAHSPAILLALACPALLVGRWKLDERGRRLVLLLVGVALLICASYLLYIPFDDWWYLRFILTALLCAIVLMAVLLARVVARFAATKRAAVLGFVVLVLVTYQLYYAIDKGLFNLREVEHRYIDNAAAVARLTPENALIFSMQESGSLRYYARRLTVRWDAVPYTRLDQAVAEFERRGRPVYFLLEDWEETQFKRMFSRTSKLGSLGWPPIAQMERPMRVRLYDPMQRSPDLRPVQIPRSTMFDCWRPF